MQHLPPTLAPPSQHQAGLPWSEYPLSIQQRSSVDPSGTSSNCPVQQLVEPRLTEVVPTGKQHTGESGLNRSWTEQISRWDASARALQHWSADWQVWSGSRHR